MASRINWNDNFHMFIFGCPFFPLGSIFTAFGISLPDLQCVFGTALSDVSSLYLYFGCSAAVGSLVAIPCLKRFNPYLLLGTAMMIESVSSATIAVSPHFYVAQALLVLDGLSCGILFTGLNYMAGHLFPDSNVLFMWLTATTAAGSLFAPFLAQPFVGKLRETLNNSNSSSALALSDKSISGSLFNITQNANGTNQLSTYCEDTESTIVFLYVIIGAMGVPFVIVFGVYYFSGFRVDDSGRSIDQMKNSTSSREVVLIILIAMQTPVAYGMPTVLGSFLTTIGPEAVRGDGLSDMLLLASLFWLCILIGRLIFIPVGCYVSHTVIIWMSLIFSFIGMTVASLSPVLGNVCLWVGSLVVAFSVSPQYACLFNWARDHVRFRHVHASVIVLANYVGITFLPYASGQLISSYGPYSLNYLCLALTVYGLILFSMLSIVGRSVKNVALEYTNMDINDEE